MGDSSIYPPGAIDTSIPSGHGHAQERHGVGPDQMVTASMTLKEWVFLLGLVAGGVIWFGTVKEYGPRIDVLEKKQAADHEALIEIRGKLELILERQNDIFEALGRRKQ